MIFLLIFKPLPNARKRKQFIPQGAMSVAVIVFAFANLLT
jgi:hypothetical protein